MEVRNMRIYFEPVTIEDYRKSHYKRYRALMLWIDKEGAIQEIFRIPISKKKLIEA